MSSFPDWLYRFTPRDEQVTPLEVVIHTLSGTDTTNAISTNGYEVPVDKILIINSVTYDSYVGTAGDYLESVSLAVTPTKSVSNAPIGFIAGVTANLNKGVTTYENAYHNVGNTFLIPSDHTLYGWAFFFDSGSAGAHNKYIKATINGVLIPRGNFAV